MYNRNQRPRDWNNEKEVFNYLDDLANDDIMGYARADLTLRRELGFDLSVEMALAWIIHAFRRLRQDAGRKCVEEIWHKTETHEQRVALMNQPGLFELLPLRMLRRTRDEVFENGDFSRLGVGWLFCSGHIEDVLLDAELKKRFMRTHLLECVEDLGDEAAEQADAELSRRIEHGMGPDEDSSLRTKEFLSACNLVTNRATPKDLALSVASELIIQLVGYQSRRDRECGLDSSQRIAHTKLRTLHTLCDIITNMMTPSNAGIVLRWVLLARRRHRHFVWERLTDALKRNHWRIRKVVEIDGKLGIEWTVRNQTMRVFSSDQDQIGQLREGSLVLVPGTHELGEPAQTEKKRRTWRAPLHPLARPTEAMEADPSSYLS